ncbi:hypothetical protein Tco_1217779 [Tanacetum coccineum]
MRIKTKIPPLDQTGRSKRRRAGKEPESTSTPKEKTSKTTGKSTEGYRHNLEFNTGVNEDPNYERPSFPDWFQKPAKPSTLDRDWNKTLPDAHGPNVDQKLHVATTNMQFGEFTHWTEKLPSNYMDSMAKGNLTRDVYSKRRIIAVKELQIVEWHNYTHLDWITIRRDDDKLNKFKEGDFNKLRIQDIEDMLLLLV